MAGFNDEDPRNVRGDRLETPEEQLFRIVLDCLAYEGYGCMTLKAIDERCQSEELKEILSGYGTKEDLCAAALEDGAERVALVYGKITAEARAYLEAAGAGTPSTRKKGEEGADASDSARSVGDAERQPVVYGERQSVGLCWEPEDEGFKQLERLLYRHIYQCFHPKNRIYVLAAAQESQLPPGLGQILPDALWQCFGSVLARLIYQVSQVKNAQVAAMCACAVCGSINLFVQQPKYCKNVCRGQTGREPDYGVIEDLLNNHFLRAIAADTAINKAF